MATNILQWPFSRDGLPIDQRHKQRFPLKMPVAYKLGDVFGTGKTINIGSKGAMITTTRPLPVGQRVHLTINWPAELQIDEKNTCLLKLVVDGIVVWASQDRAGIWFEHCEFHTRKA